MVTKRIMVKRMKTMIKKLTNWVVVEIVEVGSLKVQKGFHLLTRRNAYAVARTLAYWRSKMMLPLTAMRRPSLLVPSRA